MSFIQIRLCSQNVGQIQYSNELPGYRKNACHATLRKCEEKGRRRCIQEQWDWAVPSSIMNTPRRMESSGSCQDTSFSFEVNAKGPAQDTRSEARTGVGVSLLFCAQTAGEEWCVLVWGVCTGTARSPSLNHNLLWSGRWVPLNWMHVCTESLWSVLHTSKL